MTAKQLICNTTTNLRFYSRNRLLVLVAIFFAIVFLISIVPTAFTLSKKFNTIQAFVSTADGFLFMVGAILGLVTVSHHVRTRSLKLVVTHPCTMEAWVLSHFVSALIVVATLFVGILAIALILFLVWGLPVQWGLVYVVVLGLCSTMVIFAFLLFLSTIVHPVVAALIAMIFTPGSLLWLNTTFRAQTEMLPDGYLKTVNQLVQVIFRGLYLLWPEYSPLTGQLTTLQASYRITSGDIYLVFTAVLYTTVLCALSFFLTSAVLKKRRHI
jgi:hypothetical protein